MISAIQKIQTAILVQDSIIFAITTSIDVAFLQFDILLQPL